VWFGLIAFDARGDDGGWSPTSAPPAVVRAREVVASTRPPAASLGRPIAVPAKDTATSTTSVVPVSFQADPVAVSSAVSSSVVREPLFRGQAPDSVAPGTGGTPGGTPFENGAVAPPAVAPGSKGFLEKGWDGFLGSCHRNCGQAFQSDHGGDFDQFSSPISSPFLTVDPRALTEIKPLFIYQTIPTRNDAFRGGSIEFFGFTGSVAFTERWALVFNKVGFIALQPDDKTFTEGKDRTGFAELWLGPKYTFYRDDCNNTVAAAGLMFQFPTGSRRDFQDTGSLSLAPYLSFGKTFGKIPGQFGQFNYMSTTGFSFGTDNQRSDYFYSNFHLDFDVGGQHKLYPTMELNYTRYISGGDRQVFFNSEGNDLFNFGSQHVRPRNLVTLATGLRYKFTEQLQSGVAFEFQLTNAKDVNDFRITVDVIFRY
jgi:hypothetical protein